MTAESPSSDELPILAHRRRAVSVDSANSNAPINMDESCELTDPDGSPPPPPEAISKPRPKHVAIQASPATASAIAAKRAQLDRIVATMHTSYFKGNRPSESNASPSQRGRSESVDSAEFGAAIYIDEWEFAHPDGTPPPPEAIHKPKLQGAAIQASLAADAAIASAKRAQLGHIIATSRMKYEQVEQTSAAHATVNTLAGLESNGFVEVGTPPLPVEVVRKSKSTAILDPSIQTAVKRRRHVVSASGGKVAEVAQEPADNGNTAFARHLARCVMSDAEIPAGPLTAKHRSILNQLQLVLPQRSPQGIPDEMLNSSHWRGGFAHVPVYKFCEMCVDARHQSWYTHDQKLKMKDAHFHSPLLDFDKLEENRSKARQMIIDAGALCSQYRYETNNRLFVKLSDCSGFVVVDHAMAHNIGQHLLTRVQDIMPHTVPYQVIIQDAKSDKKYVLAQYVLRLSKVFKDQTIDARRIFYLDGNPLNCKLDNLLVLSEYRVTTKPQTHQYGVHNLMIDTRHADYATKEALLLRNSWCVPAGKELDKKPVHSLQACSKIRTRKDLFAHCARYQWSIQYNANVTFKCEQPSESAHPMFQYSAILTVVKALAVSDIVLAILGETPKSLHGKDKSKQLQCSDACWLL